MIVLGTLIASGEDRLISNAAPLFVAPPEYRFVPYWRVTPVRPGSIMKVTVPGVMPVFEVAMRDASAMGTLKVSLPPPMLLTCTPTPFWPMLQPSLDRKTTVDDGMRIG